MYNIVLYTIILAVRVMYDVMEHDTVDGIKTMSPSITSYQKCTGSATRNEHSKTSRRVTLREEFAGDGQWGGGIVTSQVAGAAAAEADQAQRRMGSEENDDDLSQLTAIITGPSDTPYFGGAFRLRLSLDGGYPGKPPRAVFETRIFHPNVSAAGEVCVSTLARDWRPELGLAHALVSVRALLLAPNADSALNAEAAALLRDDYAQYAARARLYTDIHALPASPTATAADAHGSDSHLPEQDVEQTKDGDEGPSAKRERRPGAGGASGASGAGGASGTSKARAGADKRDRRRILKRL
ncbi:ubiquitin-conjugating enzyme domain-containing protein [Phthorimaea operculella]|nr:ubiquitin-conjugating enzyme domain-containing protein [Phthorimaea operculella]